MYYNPYATIGQGIGTMNNLGGNIGDAFAQANAFSSANMANKVPYDVEMARQTGANQRLKTMAPLLAALFGGGGAGGGGLQNISTNYGAGVNYGSNVGQQAINTDGYTDGMKKQLQAAQFRQQMQQFGGGDRNPNTPQNISRPTASRTYQSYPGYRGQ